MERANQDVQTMMMIWMQTNKSKHWAESLRFIQFMKNRSFHQGIQKSPYEAMFGCKAKVGLSTSNLPIEVIDNLVTDEDLENFEQETDYAVNTAICSANEPAAMAMETSESPDQLSDNKNANKFCVICQQSSLAYFCGSCGEVVHAWNK